MSDEKQQRTTHFAVNAPVFQSLTQMQFDLSMRVVNLLHGAKDVANVLLRQHRRVQLGTLHIIIIISIIIIIIIITIMNTININKQASIPLGTVPNSR